MLGSTRSRASSATRPPITYYSDYRKQRRPGESMNISRSFRIREGMSFNVRMELYNVFNRSYWYDPTGTALTNFKQLQTRLPNGITSAGFGRVLATAGTFFRNTANRAPRQGLLVARITF